MIEKGSGFAPFLYITLVLSGCILSDQMKFRKIPKQVVELIIITILSLFVYILSVRYDLLEKVVLFSRKHEELEIDEFIIVSLFLVLCLLVFITRRRIDYRKTESVLLEKNRKLEEALSEIKQLKGIIPICASCKKIRDDDGFWHQVEVYVKMHSDADFSHGLCPDCAEKLYPDAYARINKKK